MESVSLELAFLRNSNKHNALALGSIWPQRLQLHISWWAAGGPWFGARSVQFDILDMTRFHEHINT
jgi:hypothetical protein